LAAGAWHGIVRVRFNDGREDTAMPLNRYVIGRDVPDIGAMNRGQLAQAAATSNSALSQLAPRVQWEHSYVAGNKTFCVYLAEDEDGIRRHAELSGFPASKITPISRIIDPTTETEEA
jgi:hypothetical protein